MERTLSAANFTRSLNRVLVHEGGYSNHPKDPGGVTLEGVIQRVYDGYRLRNGKPQKALTPSMRGTPEWIGERAEIYRIQYWNKICGDELPPGIDYVVFDGAVNSGPVQSIKWLQRALGVTADGELGEGTMGALADCADYEALVADICARRMAFLKALQTFPTFGKGWTERVRNVQRVGQSWVANVKAPVALFVEGSDAKATTSSVTTAPVRVGTSASAATGSALGAGIMDKLQDASSAIAPLSDTLAIVGYILTAIAVVGAGLTLYGIYRDWKAQRARNGEDTDYVEGAI